MTPPDFDRLTGEHGARVAAAEREVAEWRWAARHGLLHRQLPGFDEVAGAAWLPAPARPDRETAYGLDEQGIAVVERRYGYGDVSAELALTRARQLHEAVFYGHYETEDGQPFVIAEYVWQVAFEGGRAVRLEFHHRDGARGVRELV